MKNNKILIVDDDPSFVDTLKELLELRGYVVFTSLTYRSGEEILANADVDLVLVDLRLADNTDTKDETGREFVHKVKPSIPKILLTSFPNHEVTRDLLRVRENGASPAVDVLSKDVGIEGIIAAIEKNIVKKRNYWIFYASSVVFIGIALLLWKEGFVGLIIAIAISLSVKFVVDFVVRKF